MALFVFTTLLSILFATFYIYVKFIYSYWKRRGVPYIEPSIPFGNFGETIRGVRSLGQNMRALYNASNDRIVGVYFALRPALIIRDPKIIRDVLIKDFQSFRDRGFHLDSKVDPLVANLFFSDENWREMRTKLSPAFTSGKLKGMFQTFVDCAKPLEDCINQHAIAGKEVEVREIFSRFTSNAIASIGFGLEIDSFKEPNNEFREKGSRFFEPSFITPFRFNMSFITPFLTKLLGIRIVDKDVSDFMVEAVRQNLEYREKNNIVRRDFFQLLMQVRNSGKIQDDNDDWDAKATETNEKMLSINDMAGQAYIFILAGYESSSTVMTFFMYELANNPAIQQKVYDEICDVLQKHGKLSYDALVEMKYLESCIDETLRKHPPFDLLYRLCTKDYKISDSDIVIKKGTPLFFSVTGSQSDPKYWNDPDEFMPERFMDDRNFNKNSTDTPYLTFGDGPRNCIGLRLGKLQAKIGICILLRKFSFELGESLANKKLEFEPLAESRIVVGGVHLKIKSR